MQLESTFNDFSKLVDVFAQDATIFRDNISGKVSQKKKKCHFFNIFTVAMLSNQAAMAQYISTIYDASIGAEAAEGTIQKRFQQTSATQLQAVNDAEAAMAYCQDEVLPELVSKMDKKKEKKEKG